MIYQITIDIVNCKNGDVVMNVGEGEVGEGCESGPVGTQMTNSPTSQKNSEMRQATCKHIIAWWDEMGRVRKQSNQ